LVYQRLDPTKYGLAVCAFVKKEKQAEMQQKIVIVSSFIIIQISFY